MNLLLFINANNCRDAKNSWLFIAHTSRPNDLRFEFALHRLYSILSLSRFIEFDDETDFNCCAALRMYLYVCSMKGSKLILPDKQKSYEATSCIYMSVD